MTENKLELHDDNYLETAELFFNINDISLMQYATNKDGALLLAFIVDGTQIIMPFGSEDNRKALFKEIINRKRALAIGKEAFQRYLNEQKKEAARKLKEEKAENAA